MYEFRAQLQAETMDSFLQALFEKGGEKRLLEWFMRVLTRDNHVMMVQSMVYLRVEQLRVLYDIFNLKTMNDMDIQSFFYLATRAAEEEGYKI